MQNFTTIHFVIVIALILVLFSLFKVFFLKSKIDSKYIPKKLMTDNEFEFFNRLVRALPDYFIFSQVSMGAILEANGESPEEDRKLRYDFGYKIIDYVVYDKQKKIIALVELDDRTHDKERDYKRDIMLRSAGYKVLRFESKRKPKIEEIKKIFSSLSN